MKAQLNTLIKTRAAIEKAIEGRDATALKRSDEWYNGAKGKKYELATAMLANALDTLNDAITELEIYIKHTQ